MIIRKLFFLAVVGAAALACAAETPAADSLAEGKSAVAAAEAKLSAAELEQRGDIFRSQNDLDEARKYYDRALKKNARNPKLWNKLGVMSLKTRDYPQAQGEFSQAIKYDKRFAEAVNNLGVVFFFKKDYVRASAQYRKAIELADTASFHSNLGALYFETDDPQRALEQYRIAVQMDPQVLERNSATGVSAHAGNAIDRGRYAFLMARLYAKLGDVDHSLSHLKNAVQNGYKPPEDFMTDTDFATVRLDPRFPDVMSTPVEPASQ